MEDQKATKPQVKFDTMKAFAGMGAAVEVLMKAAPNAFTLTLLSLVKSSRVSFVVAKQHDHSWCFLKTRL
ncbi:TPA: hypothetical protein SIE14_003503 [Escherichia coli]|nr:hypothetical protein [Escherichia coli]